MESVSDVLIIYGIGYRFVGILVPIAVSYNDEVVRILSDYCDNRIRISFDCIPILRCRFIEYFENDIVEIAIFRSHCLEETLCVFHIVGGFVGMVIDNHVNVVVDGRLNDVVHQSLVFADVRKIIAGSPILVDTHRGAD